MHAMVLEWGRFRIELGKRTCIMGILNTTPDSFSDGGRYLRYEDAVTQGLKLVTDGAGILDIGGESTRPFSRPVTDQEEMDRVIPVIEHLVSRIDVPISIDTTKARVAEAALEAGAAMINDISALTKDPDMAALAARKKVPVILMHMKGTPETMQVNPVYTDLLLEITTYLEQRANAAVKAGIARDRVILDPGIGFGKTVEHNLTLIRRLDVLLGMGYPILMGPSRKSFVQKLLSSSRGTEVKALSLEAGYGTQGAVAACVMNGAHIVRVHDVASIAPLVQVINAVQNS